MAAETWTEWGARLEDGLTTVRPSREAAELTVRSIRGRHGAATLVQRQHTVTDWTETEESP